MLEAVNGLDQMTSNGRYEDCITLVAKTGSLIHAYIHNLCKVDERAGADLVRKYLEALSVAEFMSGEIKEHDN